jgi:hypothetical protein
MPDARAVGMRALDLAHRLEEVEAERLLAQLLD